MKKLLSLALALLMLAVMLPVTAMAEGNPTCVDGVWQNVTPANAQDVLDGKYGPIDGTTIILSEGTYGKLELGRATKFADSNTDYYIGGVAEENKKTYEEFVAIKTNGEWSPSSYYVRNMSNVTLKAAQGATVTVEGLTGTSGHVYGESYDYVLDKAYTSGSAYYLTQNWSNITIEGITFTAPVNISSSLGTTVIDGVTFKNCIFNIGSTEGTGNQALRYYNENNDGKVKNLTVDGCSFNTCFQGVYTQKIKGVTVINSTFDTTGHNAIAIQDAGPCDHGAVVITGNTFTNIGDRIIRFGSVSDGTAITISGNTSTNSGDASGEIIKATSLPDGMQVTMSNNNWGKKGEKDPTFGEGFTEVTVIEEPTIIIVPSTEEPKPDEDQKNPATGANDYVGVAAAAAVMALLGSAVVLRKK